MRKQMPTKALSVFLTAALLLSAAPLIGFVGLKLPGIALLMKNTLTAKAVRVFLFEDERHEPSQVTPVC